MSDSKTEYQVDYRLKLDGKDYEPGKKIKLTDKKAKPLLETNPPVISLPGEDKEDTSNDGEDVNLKTEPEDLAERIDAIKVEIHKLDKNDNTKWTASGMPDANVLTEMLGWKVKAKERDWAWKQIQKQEKDQG